LAGIYIHIPFCRQACHYCDFHFSTNLDRMQEMTDMICLEINLRKNYLKGERVETVYFGGGTPSLLPAAQLTQILQQIGNSTNVNWKETTLEANPDDLSPSKLDEWKNMGFDRLSLGVQSFDDEVLKFYNRAHTATESKQAIHKARKAGFEKFSLDLIYGFPYTDHSLWKEDLKTALDQEVGHISSYALTVEPKTALGTWEKKGKFVAAGEDFVAEQFEILQEMTDKAGYIQYEVSNFGKPDQFALHNSNYWKGTPYLGVGPSAHSFDGENRGSNPSNNAIYIKKLCTGSEAFKADFLSEQDRLNEYILTGLRTIWGIDLGWIKDKYGYDLALQKAGILNQLNKEGRIFWKDKKLSLSKSGKLLADSISAALFK